MRRRVPAVLAVVVLAVFAITVGGRAFAVLQRARIGLGLGSGDLTLASTGYTSGTVAASK